MKPHFAYLDGIRAIAAFYVFAGHAYQWQFQGVYPGAIGWLVNWLLYGHLAVSCFIVLSGFCLGLSVGDRPLPYGRFMWRRCRRILPGYYGALAIGGLLVMFNQLLRLGFVLAVPQQAVLTNLLLLTDLFHGDARWFSAPLWSVCLEFRLYLVFPFLAWVLRRYGAVCLLFVAALITTLLTIAFNATLTDPSYTFPWYILLLCFGLLASQYKPSPHVIYWLAGSGACLLLLLIRYPIAQVEAFHEALLPIDLATGVFIAAALVLLAEDSATSQLLSTNFLGWCAVWSYSLYLLHYPLLQLFNTVLKMCGVVGWSAIALETVPIFALCYLFSLVFERPMNYSQPRS